MNLLPDIIIGNVSYRAFVVQMAHGTLGETRLQCNEIYLADITTDQPRLNTLLHECVHIILEQAGQLEAAQNEGLIVALTYGLLGLVQNNPELIAVLSGNTLLELETKEIDL